MDALGNQSVGALDLLGCHARTAGSKLLLNSLLRQGRCRQKGERGGARNYTTFCGAFHAELLVIIQIIPGRCMLPHPLVSPPFAKLLPPPQRACRLLFWVRLLPSTNSSARELRNESFRHADEDAGYSNNCLCPHAGAAVSHLLLLLEV
jgi:hypothetical protein